MTGARITVPLNVLHVVPSYLPAVRYGGPIYSVHGLCKALAARGHRVSVFTTNVDGPGVSDVPLEVPVEIDNVHVTYFPCSTGRRLYRSAAMAEALDAAISRFDVVHLHSVFLWPTLAAARAAAAAGVPYVVAPRGMLVGDLMARKSRLLKWAWISLFERRTLAGAAAIHMTSATESDEYRKLGLPMRPMVEIPNGIDPPPGPTGTSPRTGKRPIVLHLGRLSWKKGIDRVVRALPYATAAEFIVAGNDDEGCGSGVEQLARELGVTERVRLVGPVHDRAKWDLLRSASIFVLASHSENFGNAVLEALACGVPVIVTPEVGIATSVSEFGAGLVVPGDPDRLGAAIDGLLRAPECRKRMGEAGHRVVRERFGWPSVAAAVEDLYRMAMATS